MNTFIQITSTDILSRFRDIDVDQVYLCDLPDSEFETGGRIDDVVKSSGYDESGRSVVNQQSAWNMSVYDWAHLMGL